MSDPIQEFDENLRELLEVMADEGIRHAAEGLSGMIGEDLTVSEPKVRLMPLLDIPNVLGGPETEAIGIYLRAEGAMAGQFMLIIPYGKALELVDLVLKEPIGTTQTLGSLERSALAEVGNLTSSFFLNRIDKITGMGARPSPPAVMVDMVGAILNIIIATSGGLGENVLLLEATISRGDRGIDLDFWVIPETSTLEAFAKRDR